MHLKGALSPGHQLEIARAMLREGHAEGRFWCFASTPHGLPADVARGRGQDGSGSGQDGGGQGSGQGSGQGQEEGRAAAMAAGVAGSSGAWRLTGHRQGRGRCYDALSAFGPLAPHLGRLARDAVGLASGLPRHGRCLVDCLRDSAGPRPSDRGRAASGVQGVSVRGEGGGKIGGGDGPGSDCGGGGGEGSGGGEGDVGLSFAATHLLLLYYALPNRLGWHRDDGANDGASSQPVVSLSLGQSCDFLVRQPSAACLIV